MPGNEEVKQLGRLLGNAVYCGCKGDILVDRVTDGGLADASAHAPHGAGFLELSNCASDDLFYRAGRGSDLSQSQRGQVRGIDYREPLFNRSIWPKYGCDASDDFLRNMRLHQLGNGANLLRRSCGQRERKAGIDFRCLQNLRPRKEENVKDPMR